MREKALSGRLIAGSSESCADILYAGGFHAPDAFVYFETCGRKGLLVSPLEYSRALSEARKGVEVINREEFLPHGEKDRGTGALLASLSARLGVKGWTVPPDFPLSLADRLRAADVAVECAKGEFIPRRRRKLAWELAAMRKAQRITEEAMELARSVIHDAKTGSRGVLSLSGRALTSEFVRTEIEVWLKRMGCSAFRTIVACGPCSAEPHNTGSGPLEAGKPIIVDIFPRHDISGYWGDMTRTFVKGKAPAMLRKAFNAVLAAQSEAKRMIKAGVPAADVHRAAFDSLQASGFKTGRRNGVPCGFIHGLGHGVGLEIHEAPRVSPANASPLEDGNVVSVEPGLYYPEWGGVRLEDLVVVRKGPCECLNRTPCELEIS